MKMESDIVAVRIYMLSGKGIDGDNTTIPPPNNRAACQNHGTMLTLGAS